MLSFPRCFEQSSPLPAGASVKIPCKTVLKGRSLTVRLNYKMARRVLLFATHFLNLVRFSYGTIYTTKSILHDYMLEFSSQISIKNSTRVSVNVLGEAIFNCLPYNMYFLISVRTELQYSILAKHPALACLRLDSASHTQYYEN